MRGLDVSKRHDAGKGAAPQRLHWESGLEIREIYTPDDVERSGGSDGIGEPGEYPYTRGIHPLMYRKRPWTMRQYSGFGTAEETHERF
ncbi:MAG: hypothetical protein GY946_03415, partial [bacterium]|nr:hypothetical protein [bacterium]